MLEGLLKQFKTELNKYKTIMLLFGEKLNTETIF